VTRSKGYPGNIPETQHVARKGLNEPMVSMSTLVKQAHPTIYLDDAPAKAPAT
jgi:hypothetical protein